MPPSFAHLNGSVNLHDVEEVFLTCAAELGSLLPAYPDGEVGGADPDDPAKPVAGARSYWIQYQIPVLEQATGLKRVADLDLNGDPVAQFTTTGEKVRFGPLGYAREYLASYGRFVRLQGKGIIPDEARFQVQLPTPLAVVAIFAPGAIEEVLPAYHAALLTELALIAQVVPPETLQVQWDVCIEIGQLEGWFGPAVTVDSVAPGLADLVDLSPRDGATVALHLCYGDYQHKHLGPPADLGVQVDLINRINAEAQRQPDLYSITVPQDAVDTRFFEPLNGLAVPAHQKLAFGIVPYHPDQQAPGTTARQVALIDRYLRARPTGSGEVRKPEWGVCCECGLGRVTPEEAWRLIAWHRAVIREPETVRAGVT